MLKSLKELLMTFSIPSTLEGTFLYALPREVKYKDKKDGKDKSFQFWEGALLVKREGKQDSIIDIQMPEDPKLEMGEVVSLTGYIKYDTFKKSLLFVASNE